MSHKNNTDIDKPGFNADSEFFGEMRDAEEEFLGYYSEAAGSMGSKEFMDFGFGGINREIHNEPETYDEAIPIASSGRREQDKRAFSGQGMVPAAGPLNAGGRSQRIDSVPGDPLHSEANDADGFSKRTGGQALAGDEKDHVIKDEVKTIRHAYPDEKDRIIKDEIKTIQHIEFDEVNMSDAGSGWEKSVDMPDLEAPENIMSLPDEVRGFISEPFNTIDDFSSPVLIRYDVAGSSDAPVDIDAPRETGGSVDPGKNYLVGEKGPEILKLGGSSGEIIPNNVFGGNKSFTIVFENINITASENLTGEAFIDQVKSALDELAKSEFPSEAGI